MVIISTVLIFSRKGCDARTHALEAVHHALAQRLERTPRVRADGPRHLGVIGDDYRIYKKIKVISVVSLRSSPPHLSFCLHTGGEAKQEDVV